METKFFIGNYSLSLGQPYVIISAEEREQVFYAEKFIIFGGFNGQIDFLADRVKYPNIAERTIAEFISAEIDVSADDILYKILFEKYKEQVEKKNYNITVELRETNPNVMSLLLHKFPSIIKDIKTQTENKELSDLIHRYQLVTIQRTPFTLNN